METTRWVGPNSIHELDEVLVEPQWLEDRLDDPNVRVIEVDVSRTAYDEWHLPGASFWNVYTDLKDSDYATISPDALERLLRQTGVRHDSIMVFYGYAPALAMWLMKRYGHADVRILNCDRKSWHDDHRRRTTDPVDVQISDYVLSSQIHEIRASQRMVADAITDGGCMIVDVRTAPEFTGECFWPSGGQEPGARTGHIPSARHVPLDGITDERGAFQSQNELAQIFKALDSSTDQAVITYCTIGGRAATAWFALTYILGYADVRVYDGSWAEWGRNPSTPVAQGDSAK